MIADAKEMHETLRSELVAYIRSQYLGKNALLLGALSDRLDEQGILYQSPFIETSPAYKTVENGIAELDVPEWLRNFFAQMADAKLGVYKSPFKHQKDALENAYKGNDLFVSTGTGSGKTECFMWPLLSKLCVEAKVSPRTWEMRGVRAIIMYPMNALVSDQISRLRRLIGDADNKFLNIFHHITGELNRRPQFGMYTGRTPYPGIEPMLSEDRKLASSLSQMTATENEQDIDFYNQLLRDGKIPAKTNLQGFIANIQKGIHQTESDDAELITRFEMQKTCPDIIITNYSMLEYMILRPREAKIWSDTSIWLQSSPNNKLLFVIDEAHMYRGSSGGEVALLLRRLFSKLGISRDKVQFILTTASMPDATDEDKQSVHQFANSLSASSSDDFVYLTGDREVLSPGNNILIPTADLLNYVHVLPEMSGDAALANISDFLCSLGSGPKSLATWDDACNWLYSNATNYTPF